MQYNHSMKIFDLQTFLMKLKIVFSFDAEVRFLACYYLRYVSASKPFDNA
jgi:hypothetical protein